MLFNYAIVFRFCFVPISATANACHNTCPTDVATFLSKKVYNLSLVSRAYHFFATTFFSAW